MTSSSSSSSSSASSPPSSLLPFEPSAEPLEQLRAQLAADLQSRQGATRQSPLRAVVVGVVPVVAVIVLACVMMSRSGEVSAAVVVAAIAAVTAVAAVAVAPHRPALGERGAQLAVVLGVVALLAQLLQMAPGGFGGAAMCLTSTGMVAVLAAFAATIGLYRSGLPLRRWHHVGIGVVAVAGACTAVWHHCASDERGHVLVGHVVGPLVLVGVVAVVTVVVVDQLERRRRR